MGSALLLGLAIAPRARPFADKVKTQENRISAVFSFCPCLTGRGDRIRTATSTSRTEGAWQTYQCAPTAPPRSRTTQLKKGPHGRNLLNGMVGRDGFEPSTKRLKVGPRSGCHDLLFGCKHALTSREMLDMMGLSLMVSGATRCSRVQRKRVRTVSKHNPGATHEVQDHPKPGGTGAYA